MSKRNQRILAGVLVLAGILGIVAVSRTGSPQAWILKNYKVEEHRAGTDSYRLSSPQPVSATADRIRRAHKPAQVITDPAGIFLRYSDLIVAITPDSRGGSTIYLDDEDEGYRHWFVFVGGYWGTGSTGGVRGGGPGSGK